MSIVKMRTITIYCGDIKWTLPNPKNISIIDNKIIIFVFHIYLDNI